MLRNNKRTVTVINGKVSYALTGAALDTQCDIAVGMFGFGNPANADVYRPRPHQIVPKAGGWAMITRRLPPIENSFDETLRVGRIFYVDLSKSIRRCASVAV